MPVSSRTSYCSLADFDDQLLHSFSLYAGHDFIDPDGGEGPTAAAAGRPSSSRVAHTAQAPGPSHTAEAAQPAAGPSQAAGGASLEHPVGPVDVTMVSGQTPRVSFTDAHNLEPAGSTHAIRFRVPSQRASLRGLPVGTAVPMRF